MITDTNSKLETLNPKQIQNLKLKKIEPLKALKALNDETTRLHKINTRIHKEESCENLVESVVKLRKYFSVFSVFSG